jgi:hypothetical protein
MGGRRGRGKPARGPAADAGADEALRREAEAHFRWARETMLKREAEAHKAVSTEFPVSTEAPSQQPTVPLVEPPTVFEPPSVPSDDPVVQEAPGVDEPTVVEDPVAAAAIEVAPPVPSQALQPALVAEWNQLELSRRELSAEWARLSVARERIESAYERLDDLRGHLDAERRQLDRQRERMWAERFQLVTETRPSEPRPVAADRPWRNAASHLLEAVVVIRASVARRARHPLARRGSEARGEPRRARKELPPGEA